MQKKILMLVLAIFLPLQLWGGGLDYDLKQSLRELDIKRGSADLCVLTNAAYVEHTRLADIEKRSGCSIAEGNLLFYHCAVNKPLKVAVFSRDTRKVAILSEQPDGKFGQVVLSIGPEQTSDPEQWQSITKTLGSDTHMVATLNAWADGAPYDLLKCVDLHNHFCPGVTSGYLMARFIEKTWPLTGQQEYTYIASPVWCKEDAIQQLLDLTAGKKGIITRHLDKQAQAELPFDQPAGILVVRDGYKCGGVAHVLTFDWNQAWQGVDRNAGGMRVNPLSWDDDPAKYIKVPLSVELSADQVNALADAANPYQILKGFARQ